MSKVGLYSSDRKKIADVAADKTLTKRTCGHVIMLDSGSAAGSGSYTITLPTVAAAGPGWWCKLVVRETTGGNITVSASADDLGSMNIHAASVTTAGAVLSSADALRWNTARWCQNDTLELVTDGVTWCGQAVCSASAALTAAP